MSGQIKLGGTFSATGRTLDTDFEIALSDGTNDNLNVIDLASHNKVIFPGFTVTLPKVFFRRLVDNNVSTSGSGTGITFNILKGHDGNYKLHFVNRGLSFAVDDTITILGSALGGTTPANNATITVVTTGSGNRVQTATITGTPAADSAMMVSSKVVQVGSDSATPVNDYVTAGLDHIRVFHPLMSEINDGPSSVITARFTNPITKRIILASAPSETFVVAETPVVSPSTPIGNVVAKVNSTTDIELSEPISITSGMTLTFSKGNISLQDIDDVLGDKTNTTPNSLSELGHSDRNDNLFAAESETQPTSGNPISFSNMYGDSELFRVRYGRNNPMNTNDLREMVIASQWDQQALIRVTFERGYVIQGFGPTSTLSAEERAGLYIKGSWPRGLIIQLEGPQTTNNPEPNNFIPGAAILGHGGNGGGPTTSGQQDGQHAIAIDSSATFGGEGLIIENGGYIYGGGGGGAVMGGTANRFTAGGGGGAGAGAGGAANNVNIIRTYLGKTPGSRSRAQRTQPAPTQLGAGGVGSGAISPLDIATADKQDAWYLWNWFNYSRGTNGGAGAAALGGLVVSGGNGGMQGGGGGGVGVISWSSYRDGRNNIPVYGYAAASGGGGGGSSYIQSSEAGVTNLLGSNGRTADAFDGPDGEAAAIAHAGKKSSGAGKAYPGGDGGRTPGAAGGTATGEHGTSNGVEDPAISTRTTGRGAKSSSVGFYGSDDTMGSAGGGGGWGANGGNSRTGSNNPGTGGAAGKAIEANGKSFTLTTITTTFQPVDKTGANVGSIKTFSGKTQGATS